MIRFLLNNKLVQTDEPPGTLLVDFIRYDEHLTGTKIGCREGDCGACTVLIGEWKGRNNGAPGDGEPGAGTWWSGGIVYRQVTSCLTALGNVHGRHVVTVEGLNGAELSFVQRALCEEGGTQCGFCTPGFIVSMTAFCLGGQEPTMERAMAAVDGNICRCTGYKSIERALARVVQFLAAGGGPEDILPGWFADIPRRLAWLALQPNGVMKARGGRFLGGGTDLYVQQHATLVRSEIELLAGRDELRGIVEEGGRCVIGGAATVTDLKESDVIRRAFPRLDEHIRLISSTPIRNIATIAGNFVNASPIGDLSIFFLALDTQLVLFDGAKRREVPLREFFKGYKVLDKGPGELIERISFVMPVPGELFHFEKVSKRTCLDIATVNTAMRVRVEGGRIAEGHISAGGVGPVPGYLQMASGIMRDRRPDMALVEEVMEAARAAVLPIDDVRGTAEYKRLLLGQLIKAHFLTLFGDL